MLLLYSHDQVDVTAGVFGDVDEVTTLQLIPRALLILNQLDAELLLNLLDRTRTRTPTFGGRLGLESLAYL